MQESMSSYLGLIHIHGVTRSLLLTKLDTDIYIYTYIYIYIKLTGNAFFTPPVFTYPLVPQSWPGGTALMAQKQLVTEPLPKGSTVFLIRAFRIVLLWLGASKHFRISGSRGWLAG